MEGQKSWRMYVSHLSLSLSLLLWLMKEYRYAIASGYSLPFRYCAKCTGSTWISWLRSSSPPRLVWRLCPLTSLYALTLSYQDTENGGIADRPGDMVDVFHTLFGVAGQYSLLFHR